jgi:hypothetical protein
MNYKIIWTSFVLLSYLPENRPIYVYQILINLRCYCRPNLISPNAKFQSNHHVIIAIGYPLVTPHKWTKEEHPLLALQLKKTNLRNIKRLKNKLKHVEYDQKK